MLKDLPVFCICDVARGSFTWLHHGASSLRAGRGNLPTTCTCLLSDGEGIQCAHDRKIPTLPGHLCTDYNSRVGLMSGANTHRLILTASISHHDPTPTLPLTTCSTSLSAMKPFVTLAFLLAAQQVTAHCMSPVNCLKTTS
jgi:hypothetical protein